jgi:hypothetical protein
LSRPDPDSAKARPQIVAEGYDFFNINISVYSLLLAMVERNARENKPPSEVNPDLDPTRSAPGIRPADSGTTSNRFGLVGHSNPVRMVTINDGKIG